MPPGNLDDWLALQLLPGLRPIHKHRALRRFRGDPGAIAYRVPPEELAAAAGATLKAAGKIRHARARLEREVRRERRGVEKLGLRVVYPGHPGYPALLGEIADPPTVLYVRGELRAPVVRVAVVGSRRASAYGRRVAVGLGAALAGRGIEVVSGGARGIDGCAHLGALEGGGTTVAVLGSGFRHLYPPDHDKLFERIAGHGAVVTEFSLDERPQPYNFPRRNRIISGLSAAVVVVEATLRSGSLVTAAHALDQDREVLAVPGPVQSDRSEGCHRLIQDGAKLVHHSDDVVAALSPLYRGALVESQAPRASDGGRGEDPGTPDEEAVLALLDRVEPLHIDAIADRAPFGIARLQAALFGLLVRGDVEELAGHRYLRRAGAL